MMTTFTNLPETLKQQILTYLEAANFPAAKKLRDNYLLHTKTHRDENRRETNLTEAFE